MFERIAVTGIGIVSAIGRNAEATWSALTGGVCGFAPLTLFDPADARARIAAVVAGLEPREVTAAPDTSRTDALALLAAREAYGDAARAPARLGVSLGGTTGGMLETEEALLAGSLERLDPARAKRLLSHPLDRTTWHVGNDLGGACCHATICAACSSSALAILRGVSWLVRGEADVVLAGGADGLCRLTFFGFDALGALDPEPCRPFDAKRAGLGLGEGAAFLCLEREETALARGATVLGWLSGAATGAEAHHITHPEPSGKLAAELVERALEASGLGAADLDYVNAHGTGTRANDEMEATALCTALGSHAPRVLVSSTKGQLGHTLGAAGAIEAAVTVLALRHGLAPATGGLRDPEELGLRHVVGRPIAMPLRAAASCSFGFGGTGSVLVFEAADAPRRARRTSEPGRLLVSGLAALGPFGSLGPTDAASVLEAPAASKSSALGPPVLASLDPERSRRFDASSALTTRLAELALASAGLTGEGVGISAGTAFGPVERSVRFVLRAAARGVRRANPAEFPQLVASAAAGNASIYLGLRGAAFGLAGGRACTEDALAAASAWLGLEQARAFVAGGAVELDPIVCEVLGDHGGVPRREGGAALVLELESRLKARGGTALAELAGTFELDVHAPSPLAAPADAQRAAVLTTALEADGLAWLERSAWSAVTRRSTLPASGSHEAASAVAVAAAVSLVATGAAHEALTVTQAEQRLRLAWFRRAERAE